MWIKRDISTLLTSSIQPVQILMGPRQVGKSTLLKHLDMRFIEVSLDDSAQVDLARSSPEVFLDQFGEQPVLIDEAQNAPQIFPAIKRRIDLLKRINPSPPVVYRMTGSNQILMDRNVKESLAGRASFFELNTLSVAEIRSAMKDPISDILFFGGWPEFYRNPVLNRKKFLNDYITSYVEKDIVLSAGIQLTHDFAKTLRLLASRTGTLLNLSEISKIVGVNVGTIRDWVSLLERMKILYLLGPFETNLTKRLTKASKLHFLDTGLATRLQGWEEKTAMMTSPQFGPLFESMVFGEVYRFINDRGLGWRMFHWRTREKEEVDLLIQVDHQSWITIEAKIQAEQPRPISEFTDLRKVVQDQMVTSLACHLVGDQPVGASIPIECLAAELDRRRMLNAE